MKKYATWFKNLSRVGQISVLSAITLGGLFAVSASTPPQTLTPPAVTSVAPIVETEKEPVITTKVETETQPIAFEKQTIEDNSIKKGIETVKVTGVDGVKTITHTITLSNGTESGRKSTETVTTDPVTEIIAVGTYVEPASSCDANYSGCVPIVSYDLDCKDIGYSVTVLAYDKHRFDADNDGYGCESY